MFELGQVVYSKAGRDQGKIYVICGLIDEHFIFLTDGDKRPFARPKKKNKKHLQPTNVVLAELGARFRQRRNVTDAEIRKALSETSVLPEGGEAS